MALLGEELPHGRLLGGRQGISECLVEPGDDAVVRGPACRVCGGGWSILVGRRTVDRIVQTGRMHAEASHDDLRLHQRGPTNRPTALRASLRRHVLRLIWCEYDL